MANETEQELYDPIIDVSLDVETLALDPKAIVISVGACTATAEFHIFLSMNVQVAMERSIDGETLKWHMENHIQLYVKQLIAMQDDGLHPMDMFGKLREWLHTAGCVDNNYLVWMNSPAFDSVILASLAKQTGASLPWEFRQERDLRTLKSLAKLKDFDAFAELPSPSDNAHDALIDARYQLEIITLCKAILAD